MTDRVGLTNGQALPPAYSSVQDAPTTPGKRVAVVDRQKVDPTLLKAAEGMESMFLDYMMKVMRDSIPNEGGGGADSAAQQIYGGMRDSEFAKIAAKRGGIGLSEQIIAYLESQRYTQNRVPVRREEAPQDRTGGLDEGQSKHDTFRPKQRD